MPELPPPPAADHRTAEAGWYPDPQAPDILRWWDGEEWSETDFTLPGAAGYPWWHQDAWRERFGPLSRVGSLFNLACCSVLLMVNLRLIGSSVTAFWIIPVILEAAFAAIAIRAWWPRNGVR
ncbi:uncharacterized protein DUF2510 [Agromyces ramosus]|uniref:Uncharacterized protein DUF2510 n=1 Tax=Agromyces ramosus TaxID=33879 RepID=A0A4V2EYL1_9MICO|nr:DUF2510 domain-containing protein [Agromyces ramosus]RZS63370.1 uncharacterized protein DUF2510 [Agromyces ramosus]